MKMSPTNTNREYFNTIAPHRDAWRKKNKYYYSQIENLYKFFVPQNKRIIEFGCSTGNLLAAVKPSYGVGIDIADKLIKIAKKKYPKLTFIAADVQQLPVVDTFDYVIFSDIIGNLEDIQEAFEQIHKVTNEKSRIIVTHYNNLWEWLLVIAEKIGLKMPQPVGNWISSNDIKNIVFLANLEIIKTGEAILFPFYIPVISHIVNQYLARLPLIRNFCLIKYYIVRKKPDLYSDKEYSVSVIIPARNEKGNIERAVLLTPKLGINTEIIFVESGSTDDTYEEIKRVTQKYKEKDISHFQITQKGKGSAVRKGFNEAKYDILMILDADLTVIPEDLSKFYHAIRTRKGEFVMGTRLVYPMEKEAMRFLNKLGNIFFSFAFSWILDQSIRDTLCGTKVLFQDDYKEIVKNRSYFGDFDPFGDFDLIFGASKLNLKIVEIPVRYYARNYGTTNISRFRHGLLLLKMTLFATKKIKFV